jgi:hypothetical protein
MSPPPFERHVNSKVTILLGGNTAGTNAIVARNIVLVGGNGVTLSGDPRGSVLFAAGGGTGGAGGTTSYTSIYSISTYRSNAWSLLGVAVQSDDPGAGVQYSQWLAGSAGYWGWYRIP